MLPTSHADEREYKDIPVRELLAVALENDIADAILDFTNDALTHNVAMIDHDDALRSVTTKLNDFILSFAETDEGRCPETIFTAIHLCLIEHINRMQQDGRINDLLRGKIN
jgi:hypothetical protein